MMKSTRALTQEWNGTFRVMAE